MTDTKTTPIELAREIMEARDQIEATSHKAKDFVPNCVVVAVHSLELLEQAEQLAQAVIDEQPLHQKLQEMGVKEKPSSQREAYQRGHAEGERGQKEKDAKLIQDILDGMAVGKILANKIRENI